MCDFTCEKHMELEHIHLRNFHFVCEIGTTSDMKYLTNLYRSDLDQIFRCAILVFET